MSTRSLICKELPNGKFRTIYCNYYGGLEHNGLLLCDVYDTSEKVDKLLDLGDLSQLERKLYPTDDIKHNGEYRQKGVCVAYGRDHGEKNTEAKEYDSLKKLFEKAYKSWAEFVYIFTKDNEWIYTTHAIDKSNLKPATEQFFREQFDDLSSEIDKHFSVEDRFELTDKKIEKINKLEKRIEQELEDFRDNCSKLAPDDVYLLASDIMTYQGLYRFLKTQDENFTEKELDILNSTKSLLFELNARHISHNPYIHYNFDGYRNAIEFFIHEAEDEHSGEMC